MSVHNFKYSLRCDEAGTKLISYRYDAWGNWSSLFHNNGYSSVARQNPFRYRGYYYDEDLRFYYLNSRYYDPATGRFINADSYVSTGQGILGNNMFAYCLNNPVMGIDPMGYRTYSIGVSASFCIFIGVTGSFMYSFDDYGNFAIQYSYTNPIYVGSPGAGVSVFLGTTNLDNVESLTKDKSTNVGASVSDLISFGGDVILGEKTNDDGSKSVELVGAQASFGISTPGVERHVSVTKTETLCSFNIVETYDTVVHYCKEGISWLGRALRIN